MQKDDKLAALKNWRPILKPYQKPDNKKAILQLFNTFLPFLAVWILMYFSLEWSYFITLGLALVNAFLLVRIFIIQHDCGHQSFTDSRRGNDIIGYFASFFSTIPYKSWSGMHNFHHAHNGQLEYRGMGDIYYMTTEEYQRKSGFGKFIYRFFRTPFIQFIFAPAYYLLIALRISAVHLPGWEKVSWSHHINNILVIGGYIGLAFLLGWPKFLLIQLPIVFLFIVIAFWFFYVQHQHEENYKSPEADWNFLEASVYGSTYYKLPRLFQWLSGNIGFHHIHHLNSCIPNYHLEACYKENPVLSEYVPTLTFRESLGCLQHKLWDPGQRRMITFREYYSIY